MVVTIQKDGVTFTFQEGDVESVEPQLRIPIDENPVPGTTSDGAFILDFNGMIHTITITGRLTDASTSRTSSGTVTTIQQQVDWLFSIANGFQTGVTLTTTYLNGINVYMRGFRYPEYNGKPNELEFVIEFVEGA